MSEKLSILGKELLLDTLPSIIDETCSRIKQKDEEATYTHLIKREDEKLDLNKPCNEIVNKIKALCEIGPYLYLDDMEIKVFAAEVGTDISEEPGKIINIYKNGIGVATNDKELVIKRLQVPGKKIMDARDFLNGIDKESLKNKYLK